VIRFLPVAVHPIRISGYQDSKRKHEGKKETCISNRVRHDRKEEEGRNFVVQEREQLTDEVSGHEISLTLKRFRLGDSDSNVHTTVCTNGISG